jgi:hypothetical protein
MNLHVSAAIAGASLIKTLISRCDEDDLKSNIQVSVNV